MTYSATNSISTDLETLDRISPGTQAYFRARLKRRLYSLVMSKFREAASAGLTKAELARRIGKKPEVITRLMANPGNWRSDTVADLLLGISGEELLPASASPLAAAPRNMRPQDQTLSSAPSFHIRPIAA